MYVNNRHVPTKPIKLLHILSGWPVLIFSARNRKTVCTRKTVAIARFFILAGFTTTAFNYRITIESSQSEPTRGRVGCVASTLARRPFTQFLPVLIGLRAIAYSRCPKVTSSTGRPSEEGDTRPTVQSRAELVDVFMAGLAGAAALGWLWEPIVEVVDRWSDSESLARTLPLTVFLVAVFLVVAVPLGAMCFRQLRRRFDTYLSRRLSASKHRGL